MGVLAVFAAGCCDEDASASYRYDSIEFGYSHEDSELVPIPAGQIFELAVTTPLTARYAQRRCFSLIPAAYAMQQCPEGQYRYPRISSITLVSDADYDDTHPAGTDLSLLAGAYGSAPLARFDPFIHVFRTPPAAAKRHRFTATITNYEDGEPVELVAQSADIVWE